MLVTPSLNAIFALYTLQEQDGMRFAKWHGTGNDFILVDDRAALFPTANVELITRMSDRHLGIGSDGLILIQPPTIDGTDFHMEFYNPDGSRSFCGNGSRCAFAFWCTLGGGPEGSFSAIDGIHQARLNEGTVTVTMNFEGTVDQATDGPDVDHVNTGSPHELVWVEDPASVVLMEEGPRRRYDARHGSAGTNVNFLRVQQGEVEMRTYERGVEAETLSCGTGVVAAALSALQRGLVRSPVPVLTRGGKLQVQATSDGVVGFSEVRLSGPAVEVFNGEWKGRT